MRDSNCHIRIHIILLQRVIMVYHHNDENRCTPHKYGANGLNAGGFAELVSPNLFSNAIMKRKLVKYK